MDKYLYEIESLLADLQPQKVYWRTYVYTLKLLRGFLAHLHIVFSLSRKT